jgi:hypothetical protein
MRIDALEFSAKVAYVDVSNPSNSIVRYGKTGVMAGVTRQPHPESNKCLKSNAPASGVPARPRVFFMFPTSSPLPNPARGSAPSSAQGCAGVVWS